MRGLRRLDRFNRLSEAEAIGELLAVCHARRWAQRVAAGRPYADVAALQRAADEVWTSLGPDDWLEALEGHPRIGEGGGRSPEWSRQEQAGVGGAGQDLEERLARGNAEYEARFGHVFLISAAGATSPRSWPPSTGGWATTPTPSCGWPPTSTGASPACGSSG